MGRSKKKKLVIRWREKTGQRQKTFQTRAEYTAYLWKLERDKTLGIQPSTFGSLCDRYLAEHCAVMKSKRSANDDRSMIERYLREPFKDRRLDELTTADLERFRLILHAKRKPDGSPLAPRTINSVLILAKAIMAKAETWSLIAKDPWRAVKQLKQPPPVFAFWSVDERDKFLTWIKSRDLDMWRIVTVAVYTGLRKSELWALRRDQIDFKGRIIHVTASTDGNSGERREQTKNGQADAVPMAEPVFEALKHLQLAGGGEPALDQASFWSISKSFKVQCGKAGVSVIRFHDLRHTFASHLVQAGVPIYEVQKLMRHASIAMTERYAKLRRDTLKEAVDKLLFKKEAVRECAPKCARTGSSTEGSDVSL